LVKLISHIVRGVHWDESYYTIRDHRKSRREIVGSEVELLVEHDPIWEARGKAIQNYALLEHALSDLLSALSGTDVAVGATIFYKITSTSARSAIMEKLLKRKHQSTYSAFWNGYLKALRPIVIKRNEIVHWLSFALAELDSLGTLNCGVILVPPAYHDFSKSTPHLTLADLTLFTTQCDELSRLCNLFNWSTHHSEFKHPQLDALRDIFLQPLIYPLPEDHLLYKLSSEPSSQPQS
jgi:hypothetical protein